jgi:multidrug efflux pump subunit AcrA (membrane-fusion protein)
LRQLPTLIVLATLAGVGVYGHYSHWKVPKFAELTGTTAASSADWCEEHNVPESNCVECNVDRFPSGPDYGLCRTHGIPNCVLDHPDVAELKQTPVVSPADLERADRALALRNRPENNAVCKLYQRRIQFASIEAVAQAGIDVQLVERQPLSERISGTGEITYDATRLAALSPRVAGTAWRILKNIGDPVRAGEVIAVVDAMAVGQAKSELVKALVAEDLAQTDANRLAELGSEVVAAKLILEAKAVLGKAQADVLSAEQTLANLGLPVDVSTLRGLPKTTAIERLRFLGLPTELVREFDSGISTANLIPIRSSIDGVVVERQVVSGEVVDPSRVLFKVADTSQMWLSLNVPLEDAEFLSLGQPVWFLPDGSRQEVSGRLTWISTAVDKQTRMVEVRAELSNPKGQLRAETFGTGRVVLREEQDAIVVPDSAVHWEGCCQVVFVRDKDYFTSPAHPKLFHVRPVRVGVTNGDTVEIIAGLLPGEVIATQGSDVLRSQLLKNNLGAGCCAE